MSMGLWLRLFFLLLLDLCLLAGGLLKIYIGYLIREVSCYLSYR